MSEKEKVIKKFEKLVNEEIENLDKIVDDHDKFIRLDTLYKIFQYLRYFDEVEPVLTKYFEEKRKKDKWKER
jgi:hypothetical protein